MVTINKEIKTIEDTRLVESQGNHLSQSGIILTLRNENNQKL